MASPTPTIISCDAWGARQPKAPNQVLAARPTFIVIHHTATPNTSNLEQSHAMGLARSIQLDHMNRGYGDTGQHFTVSRGGWILEGRRGSLAALLSGTSQVVGAHAPGRNTDGIGIENEGTYIKENPPSPSSIPCCCCARSSAGSTVSAATASSATVTSTPLSVPGRSSTRTWRTSGPRSR
jgi:N-acetylmuramoyl-L-alanine amidase